MHDVATLSDPAKRSAAGPAIDGLLGRRAANQRFFVCLGLLVIAACTVPFSAAFLDAHFRKLELPTKKPLYAMDSLALLPRYSLAPPEVQQRPLGHEEVANLGTENYLMWQILDRELQPTDPTYRAHISLTYYSGKPNMVPHNPEECNAAAGFTLVDRHKVQVSVPGPAGPAVQIPIVILGFEPPDSNQALMSGGGSQRRSVMFFFYTNGGFATTRSEVRWRVSNLADRYSYYSKIEVSFTDGKGRPASRDQSEQAVEPLLRALMPVLWRDHYQDWDAIKRGAPPVVTPS